MHWSSGRVDHPAGERYIQTCTNEWDSFELPICIPPQIPNRHNYIRSRLKFMWRMYISWGQSFELSLVAAKLNYYLGTLQSRHPSTIFECLTLCQSSGALLLRKEERETCTSHRRETTQQRLCRHDDGWEESQTITRSLHSLLHVSSTPLVARLPVSCVTSMDKCISNRICRLSVSAVWISRRPLIQCGAQIGWLYLPLSK